MPPVKKLRLPVRPPKAVSTPPVTKSPKGLEDIDDYLKTTPAKLKHPKVLRARAKNAAGLKRDALRDAVFPNSQGEYWDSSDPALKGFIAIPRLLSLVCALIKPSAKGDPTRVYYDLWCRVWGHEGIVTDIDENEFAFSSGYTGSRALRTWRTLMNELERLGFIKIASVGNKKIGHVLILNPLLVCANKHARGEVDSEWWMAFVTRANEIKAEIPAPTVVPSAK